MKEIFSSVAMNPKRMTFFEDAQKLIGTELFEKYYPITIKTKIVTVVRKVLLATGAYSAAKKVLNRVKGR